MDKPIHVGRFPKFLIRHLNRHKCKTAQDILDKEDTLQLKYINLSRILEETKIHTKTALDVAATEEVESLQNILKNGRIIEVVSLPHIDKTEFCMSLISERLKKYPEKHVFYITNTHFPKDKLYVNKYFSGADLLGRLHIACFQSYFELTQFVIHLKDFIVKTAPLSVCIIDPLAPFLKSLGFSTRISAYKLLGDLKELGFYNDFPILITNNFTTANYKGQTKISPLLNTTFCHKVDARLVINSVTDSNWNFSVVKL